MEIKLSQDKITEIFEILDQEENYGKIKLFSLYIMKAAKQPYENLHGEVKIIFNPKYKFRLKNTQMINHYPNHYELTRKDLMAKNIKRFKPLC